LWHLQRCFRHNHNGDNSRSLKAWIGRME
jgi:hypothetical protein